VQEVFQQMLQDWLKLPKSKRWPVHLKEHTSMFVYDCCGLLFVAFTMENMQPLQVFESLRAITVFLQSAFGGLTEEKVRLNTSIAISICTPSIDLFRSYSCRTARVCCCGHVPAVQTSIMCGRLCR
jgi:hypothetical protein